MNNKFGRHFSADLYMCQNELWRTPSIFTDRFQRIGGMDLEVKWVYSFWEEQVRIYSENENILLLVQVFSKKKFLALDIFSWHSDMDIKQLAEGVIQLFAPQVVATEYRVRAKHFLE